MDMVYNAQLRGRMTVIRNKKVLYGESKQKHRKVEKDCTEGLHNGAGTVYCKPELEKEEIRCNPKLIKSKTGGKN